MAKGIRTKLSVNKLVVKFDVNGREKDNYDIPTMMGQIAAAGRIIQPIIAEKMGDEIVVLAGNRRTWAGQELLKDPHIPADLKDNLEKAEVMMYEGLTEKERYEYIYDQGSQKQLGRTEVAKAVVRLSKNFFSEGEIINLLYFSLAKFTGNERKLREVPSEPKAREAMLKKWMHGTVGNYILAATKMGTYTENQFFLTLRAEDGLLKEGEKVEIRMSRDRVNKLSQAKTEDKMEWTPDNGGPKFSQLLEQFKKEDSGEITETVIKRPTIKELKERVDAFKTGAIRKVLLIAAGDQSDAVKGLSDDDDKLYRDQLVLNSLATSFDKLKAPFKDFVQHLLDDKPADFVTYLESL